MESAWNRHGEVTLRAWTGVMIAAACGWLGYEFWRLLFQQDVMGAVDLTWARWRWGGTTLLTLGSIVALLWSATRPGRDLERAFIAFIPLSMYAAGAAIGNGQLIVHVLLALLLSMLVLAGKHRGWGNLWWGPPSKGAQQLT